MRIHRTSWVSLLSSLLGAGTGIAVANLASPVFGIEHPSVVFSPAIFGAVAGGVGGGLNPGLQQKKGQGDGRGKGKAGLGMQELTETDAPGDLNSVEGRRGPGWKGWVLSILVAIILSVTATLLLGGSGSFRPGRAVAGGAAGVGCGAGSSCCPPADAGK